MSNLIQFPTTARTTETPAPAAPVNPLAAQKEKPLAVGDILKARSIGDSECIFEITVLKFTAKTVTVKAQGIERRCKIHTRDGERFIFGLGRYSMAPTFRFL